VREQKDARPRVDALTAPTSNTLFYGALDAAFADDLLTQRSSQGYLFMLYGMPIDWKATL
jgi:hypothetical protein